MGGIWCVLISVLAPACQLMDTILILTHTNILKPWGRMSPRWNCNIPFSSNYKPSLIVIRRLSQVFISDLTKELDVLKYSDDTVYLYHNKVKIIKGHQCLSLYAEIKDKLKKGRGKAQNQQSAYD